MSSGKTVLLTGATDGIGLEVAIRLAASGHELLIHGRSAAKLEAAVKKIEGQVAGVTVQKFLADMSDFGQVSRLVEALIDNGTRVDALVNNAGIFKTAMPLTADGLDVRFVVNTITPYQLTTGIEPLLAADARIVNVSSAAQQPVDLHALSGEVQLADDMQAYAQSKLAITMWTRSMAASDFGSGKVIVAVNPGSLLASKMVQEGFGVEGKDIGIGANILIEAALGDAFANASGAYYDNDSRQFADPHPAALDAAACEQVEQAVRAVIARFVQA